MGEHSHISAELDNVSVVFSIFHYDNVRNTNNQAVISPIQGLTIVDLLVWIV